MSAEAATLLLEHHLKVLKLPTFVRDYKSVAAACAQKGCDYPAFLLRLAERELIDRERRAYERTSLLVTTNRPLKTGLKCSAANA